MGCLKRISTFRHDYETFIIHNPIDDVGADKLRDAISGFRIFPQPCNTVVRTNPF